MSIDVTCGDTGNQYAASGVVQSPNYPGKYMTGGMCFYLISVQFPYVIELNVTAMRIDDAHIVEVSYQMTLQVKLYSDLFAKHNNFCRPHLI